MSSKTQLSESEENASFKHFNYKYTNIAKIFYYSMSKYYDDLKWHRLTLLHHKARVKRSHFFFFKRVFERKQI